MVAAALDAEKLLNGPEAIQLVTGERPHYATFYRWTQSGLVASDGSRIKLAFVKAGTKRKTSVESVRRFFAKLTAAAAGEQAETFAGQHSAEHEAAERELDEQLG